MLIIILLAVALCLLPFLRGFAIGLLIVGAFVVVVAHAQQQTTTRCYDAGPTKVCETKDHNGAVISTSRCYQAGKDTRCDTTSSSGTPQR